MSIAANKIIRSNNGVLITFGCSWTAGEWLPNWEANPYVFSEYSWPSMLGNALNMEVMNMAGGGNPNRQILFDIINFDKEIGYRLDDLVVVCWSFFGRELLLGHDYQNQKAKTMELLEWQDDKKFYEAHTINDLQIKTREYVHHAECFFKSKNIKYKMAQVERWEDRNRNWLIYNDEDLLLFEQVDYAEDNAHPGVESNKQFYEKLLEKIND